jgi:dephospho-CoA kinase
MSPRIVGLVGPIASGKGTICSFLQTKGFFVYTLSDIIREELARRSQEETRQTLQAIGSELRKTFGAPILAQRAADHIVHQQHQNNVIDGIRNPAELRFLKDTHQSLILGITAPLDRRFEFMRMRNRASDPSTFEEFMKHEKVDNESPDSHQQQVAACLILADVVIENTGTIDELQQKVWQVITQTFTLDEPTGLET